VFSLVVSAVVGNGKSCLPSPLEKKSPITTPIIKMRQTVNRKLFEKFLIFSKLI
jgi:hypothetical protein